MPFPPQREHRISLERAAEMTRRHRNGRPGKGELAQMFPREVLERLLSQPGAMGIRFYFGRETDEGETRLVAVAVDQDANDMTAGEIDDFGFPCPPVCSGGNELNS